MFQRKWAVMFLLVSAGVLLAGCFRQADDGFQAVGVGVGANPTVDAGAQGAQATTPPIIFEVTSAEPATLTPSLELSPEPVDDPTDSDPDGLPFDDVPDEPTEPEAPTETTPPGDQPFIVTVIPSETPQPTPTPEETADEGQTFITPGAPIAPIVIATEVPGDQDDMDMTMPDTPAPTSTPSGLITPTSMFVEDECIYIVRGGDTLFRIATNNGTTLAALRNANPQITGDLIRPGQQLTLPDCDSDVIRATATARAAVEYIEHTVRSGETLAIIAQRYGTTVSTLTRVNNLSNPNLLRIGQTILIPQN